VAVFVQNGRTPFHVSLSGGEFVVRTLVIAGLVLALSVVAGSPAAASRAPAQLASFHTPSGNIGCVAYSGFLRCDIGQFSWPRPARPKSCPLAYGDSFTMRGHGRPLWTCHGDTALHQGHALAYGRTWRHGAFTCVSRITGLTCSNRSHHGFFLSRQSYRTF
jgi:hypothetical protein